MAIETKNYATSGVERRLLEVFDVLWDDFVDPREAYAGDDGWWRRSAAACRRFVAAAGL